MNTPEVGLINTGRTEATGDHAPVVLLPGIEPVATELQGAARATWRASAGNRSGSSDLP